MKLFLRAVFFSIGILLLCCLTGCDDDSTSSATTPQASAYPDVEPFVVDTQQVYVHNEMPDQTHPPVVPAPSALLLSGIGIASVGWLKRRKKI